LGYGTTVATGINPSGRITGEAYLEPRSRRCVRPRSTSQPPSPIRGQPIPIGLTAADDVTLAPAGGGEAVGCRARRWSGFSISSTRRAASALAQAAQYANSQKRVQVYRRGPQIWGGADRCNHSFRAMATGSRSRTASRPLLSLSSAGSSMNRHSSGSASGGWTGSRLHADLSILGKLACRLAADRLPLAA
jgi:hypothetical protein